MANPFVKAWKYLMALFSSKVDEYADPKVQIQQAIEDAQRQHAALSQQAAAVIGNQRQLEMKLNRQMGEVERLQSSAKQALVLADEATKQGDADKSAKYEQTAQLFATQLVSAEQQMEDLKSMHDQALQAAEQAKKAVEQNAVVLQQKLAERTKLLSQLDQAKMQEQISASLSSMSQLNAPGTTPTLDEVREKIEKRYANALGLGCHGIEQELRRGPDARGRDVNHRHGRRGAPGPTACPDASGTRRIVDAGDPERAGICVRRCRGRGCCGRRRGDGAAGGGSARTTKLRGWAARLSPAARGLMPRSCGPRRCAVWMW